MMTETSASEAGAVAPPEQEPSAGGLRGAWSRVSGPALGTWSAISLVVGLVADIAEPVAPFAMNLLALSILLLLLCLAGMSSAKLRATAGTAAIFSGIAALVFGTIVLGQQAVPGNEGEERGVAASYIDPLAGLQNAILPISDDARAMLEFSSAISHGSDTMRAVEARDRISQTKDPLLRRGMIEALYETNRPPLRQLAISMAFAERDNDSLTLLPTGDSKLARELVGEPLHISDVDVASGALRMAWNGRRSEGTVARGEVVFPLTIVRDNQRRQVEVRLTAKDGFELSGTARLADGESAAVALPLF